MTDLAIPTSAGLAQTAAEYQAALANIKSMNVKVAEHAAGIALLLGERLGMMAMATDDPEVVRKAYDSFTRKGEVPEKLAQAQATQAMATAVFNIILDRTVKQVAPPRRPELVEEVPPPMLAGALTEVVEDDLSWGEEL